MATTAQCKRALELFEDKLSSQKNVVGLGITAADPDEKPSNNMAVAVYVRKKLPLARLKPGDVVPKHLVVPGRGLKRNVPTRVIEQGEVRLEAPLGKELA